MADPAFGAPRLDAPPPVAEPQLVAKSRASTEPLIKAGSSHAADELFRYAMLACGLCVLALVVVIIYELCRGSKLSWHAFGFSFFFRSEWDPVNEEFGALPFVYGTIVSSILALVLAVPLALGVAIFITEMCPRSLKGILAFTTELLAAIPSVIYGLWAIFVLVPLLRQYIQPWRGR
jgi:phosphate transport system permease protein